MSYKIVFFDIDGTLVDSNKKISIETQNAIQRLKEKDIEVVLATGRAPFQFLDILEELEIDSYISFTGSYVVYKGKLIYEQCLDREIIRKLEMAASRTLHPLVFLNGKACYANADEHPHIVESVHYLQLEGPRYDPDAGLENDVHQLMLYCRDNESAAYLTGFPDLRFIRWHEIAMDVLPNGASKARGVELILKEMGISPAEAIAFGDSLNDIEMLSHVGMGIAMENAHQELIPYAKFITKSNNDQGISHGLKYAGVI